MHPGNGLKDILVGREIELQVLRDALSGASGDGQKAYFIAGPSGVGKTLLLTTYLNEQTVDTIIIRHSCNTGEFTPFQPFINAFVQLSSHDEPLQEHEVKATGYFNQAIQHLGESRDNSMDNQDYISSLFQKGLTALCNHLPVVMALDNFHRADQASTQLIRYLAREMRDDRILFIMTYSPEDMEDVNGEPNPLAMTLMEMMSEMTFQTIPLDPLGQEESDIMVCKILGKETLPSGFLSMIFDSSQGNPFFIQKILESLQNQGTINLQNPDWVSELNLETISIPKTVKESIVKRLEHLSEPERDVLMNAAILGATFHKNNLLALVEKEDQEVKDLLYKLTEDGIIYEDFDSGNGVFKFDHTKVQEMVYSEIEPELLKSTHARIGKIIEEQSDKSDEDVFVLARHFSMGNIYDKTAKYAIQAGQKARNRYSYRDAITYYKDAIRALEHLDDDHDNSDTMLMAIIETGRLLDKLGKSKEAIIHLKEAIRLATSTSNKARLADALRQYAHIRREQNEWEEAERNYKAGLELSIELDDHRLSADILRGWGKILWRLGKLDEAEKYVQKSIKHAETINDRVTVGVDYIELANIYSTSGDHERSIEYYKKSIDELQETVQEVQVARSYNNMGEVYKLEGKIEKAIECYDNCITVADRFASMRMKGYGLVNKAECLAKIGRTEEALPVAQEALTLFKRMGERYMVAGTSMVFGIIYSKRQEWSKAEAAYQESIDTLTELNIPFDLAINHKEYAHYWKLIGNIDNARKHLLKAKIGFEELGSDRYIQEIEEELAKLG